MAYAQSLSQIWDSLSLEERDHAEVTEAILSQYDTLDIFPDSIYDFLSTKLSEDKKEFNDLKVKLEVLKARAELFGGNYRLSLRFLSNAKRMISGEPENHWNGTILLLFATASTATNNPTKSKAYLEELFAFTNDDVPLFHRGYFYQLYATNLLLLGEIEQAESYYTKAIILGEKEHYDKIAILYANRARIRN